MFVCVLNSMKTHDQPGEPDSVLDYSTLWSELIDCGGLYHISDEVRWFTIRGHSFAKDFTTNFVRKYKKGTRKRQHIWCQTQWMTGPLLACQLSTDIAFACLLPVAFIILTSVEVCPNTLFFLLCFPRPQHLVVISFIYKNHCRYK